MKDRVGYGVVPIWVMLAAVVLLLYSFSLSVALVILCVFIGIWLEGRFIKTEDRTIGVKLMIIVFAVYSFSAVVFSSTFEGGKAFLTPDALQYFRRLNMTSLDVDPITSIIACYGLMDDGNEMHELFVRYCILFANNQLGGANILYLTLINVFFGVITSGAVFRILLNVLPSNKAYKFALAFALLSPFHFFSVTFVRDIIIACFYAHAIEIVLGKFKLINVFLLLLFVLIVWGIRLYSGWFMLTFIVYYVYSAIQKRRSITIAIVSLLIVFLIVIPQINFSTAIDQSVTEIQNYQEYNSDRASSSSLSMKLEKLPPVIREVSLVTFAQLMPFPPYIGTVDSASTVAEMYTAILTCVFEIYWYLIAFGLLSLLLLYKKARQMTLNDWFLFAIALLFIYLNTSQLDVRRVMCIYPLILYIYAKKRNGMSKQSISRINTSLTFAYIALLVIYGVIR